ncbi:MAG: ISLre2 family transposase [Clostridiales bacterium]|nr:ISLre2 family transposase [Clostridiales bacterium]
MYEIILQCLTQNLEGFTEKLSNILKTKKDASDLAIGVKDGTDEMGRNIMTMLMETMDEVIKNEPGRSDRYEVVHTNNPNTLLCCLGSFTYDRTYYRDKKTGEYIYLCDRQFGIEPKAKTMEDSKALALEEAIETSYRKGGLNASVKETLSKGSIKNLIHNLVVEMPRPEIKEKKKVKILHINADEDHVAAQFWNVKGDLKKSEDGRKSNTIIPKLVYVYEGIEREHPTSKRWKLVEPHYFSGLYEGEKNQDLWLEVADYIDTHYDMDYLETVYLCGDGANWIKQGLSWINKSMFVLDKFHLKKYLQKSVAHMEEHTETVKQMIEDEFSFEDKVAINEIYKKLKDFAESDSKRDDIESARRYIMNNWNGIVIYNTRGHEITGCSAEGHVSHVLSSRMSSRPLGWSKKGADRIARLRAFVWNGGNIYDLLMYRKYKEKQAERDEERDTIVKRARDRIAKRETSINHSLGAINGGKVNWLHEMMKGIRGICG